MTTEQIPQGYLRDAQGRLVPTDLVEEVDQLRDSLVLDIIGRATCLREQLSAFKAQAMADVQAFVTLAAEKYDAKIGGKKGNLTLTSFDGRFCVKVQVSENIRFDERIQAAKALVDECIHDWTEGSRSEVKALVEHAFQTDKEGRISIGRILGLTRLAIEDEKWQQAMRAIRDSMKVVDTATYLRVYQRHEPDGAWEAISLDLAKL